MTININELIQHPERLDRDTLFALRELVARCPYYHAARILFLQNLFLLHDTSFGEELRRAALFVPDRSVLFQLVEGLNYEMQPKRTAKAEEVPVGSPARTVSLIDRFLTTSPGDPSGRRMPSAAEAATDYASYLMLMEHEENEPQASSSATNRDKLIDGFIESSEKIVLQEKVEYVPEIEEPSADSPTEDACFTETFAKIYIKQGKYEKAIEIIRQLEVNYPKKNAYFADQIRFLQKLIINNQNK